MTYLTKIKRLIYFCFFGLFFIISNTCANSTQNKEIVGYWETINHKTQRPSSILHITLKKEQYSGKVVYSFSDSGEKPLKRCAHCQGKRHNQPIIGLTILTGLRYEKNQYRGGMIINPRDGKKYHCQATVSDDKKKLYLRGFIGIPILGRTEIWHRVSEKQAISLIKSKSKS